MNPNDLDAVIELLDDKIVRTKQGSYIAVEDLRTLVKERAELKSEEAQLPRHRTMHAAREAAKKDEGLIKMFGPPIDPSTDVPNRMVMKERQAQTAPSA